MGVRPNASLENVFATPGRRNNPQVITAPRSV